MSEIRRGIATSEAVAKALKDNGTPLSYGATPESFRDAFTTLADGKNIGDRLIEDKVTFNATDEVASTLINTVKEETTTSTKSRNRRQQPIKTGNVVVTYRLGGKPITDEDITIVKSDLNGSNGYIDLSSVMFTDIPVGTYSVTTELSSEVIEHDIEIKSGDNEFYVDVD